MAILILSWSSEVLRNLKFQAPRQKDGGQANPNEIPNINIQHAAQAPALRVTQTGLEF